MPEGFSPRAKAKCLVQEHTAASSAIRSCPSLSVLFQLSSCGETVPCTVLSTLLQPAPMLLLLCPVSAATCILVPAQPALLETGKQGPLGRVQFWLSSASSGKVAQESVSQAACITDPEKRNGIWNSYGCSCGANHSFNLLPIRASIKGVFSLWNRETRFMEPWDSGKCDINCLK